MNIKSKIFYEYKVELINADDDVIDCRFHTNIFDALADQDLINDAVRIDLCLVRDTHESDGEFTDRQHAYIIYNHARCVPEIFDGNALVMAHHRYEIRKALFN